MISLDARPRLAPKARVRRDRHTGRTMLLYPERGLALNETAAAIVELCTGEATVNAIIDELCARYGADRRGALATEVLAFLGQLVDRNLVRGLPP